MITRSSRTVEQIDRGALGFGTRVIALTGDSTEARVRLARETFLIGLAGAGSVADAVVDAAGTNRGSVLRDRRRREPVVRY